MPDAVHRKFDAWQLEFLRTETGLVVEGRLAGWLARELDDVFRVFCTAPLAKRGERYARRERVSTAQALVEIEHRDTRDV